MRLAVVLLAPALAACFLGGEIEVVDGTTELAPAKTVSFALYCDDLILGRDLVTGGGKCEGGWAVYYDVFDGGPEGGDGAVGYIDRCGVYVAPLVRPPAPIWIVASECGPNCADGCGASLELTFEGYPP